MDQSAAPVDLRYVDQGHDITQGGAAGVAAHRYITSHRAFTLVEILIVVAVLGILAALVMPQFTNASDRTNDTSALRHLQIIRHQIEYYRAQTRTDPQMIANQWDDLLTNDYLQWTPENPFNDSSVIAPAPGPGVGWVWRDSGNGVNQIYATDKTFLAEFTE